MPSGVYKRTKPVWNKGQTKENNPIIAAAELKRQETNNERYGGNPLQVNQELQALRVTGELARRAQDTKELRYGDRNYNNMEQNKATKLDRYGDENYNNPEKNRETRIQHFGDYWSDELKQQIGQTRITNDSYGHGMQTIIAKYGNTEEYYRIVNAKRYETMRKNGTLGNKETGPERELYKQLCDQYGEDNVKKQYMDKERYPFKCDFYIIPEDKFIELHGFLTHGPHPFDKDNVNDQLLLAALQDDANAGDKWAKAIIYTWTDLDVRKLETARKNDLNFEAIYWYHQQEQ